MNIPMRITQGDTYVWTDSSGTLTDDRWQLQFSLRGPSSLDLVSIRTAGKFTFALDQTASKALTPGRYSWVTRLTERVVTPGQPQVFNVSGNLGAGSSFSLSGSLDIAGVQVGMVVDSPSIFPPGTTVTSALPNDGDLFFDQPSFEGGDVTLRILGPSTDDVISLGGQQVTLNSGQLDVLPDLTSYSAGFDALTQSERDLKACQDAIRAMINGGAVQEYQIGNRSVKKMSMESLITLETKLKYQVARERRSQGRGDSSNVLVRFSK